MWKATTRRRPVRLWTSRREAAGAAASRPRRRPSTAGRLLRRHVLRWARTSPMTGLSCSEFVELVTSHLEGKLDRDTERRFTEHLAECEGCDRYLDQFRLTIRMLGELPAESRSEEAGHRLLS